MRLSQVNEPERSDVRLVHWAPLLLVLIAGCAHYEPQPLIPDGLARSFEARSFSDAGLLRYVGQHAAAGSSRANGWNLSTLTLSAFYFSPDLDVARARDQYLSRGRSGTALVAARRTYPCVVAQR